METEKLTTKDPMVKVARQRMSVLQLAEALGNVSEACRRSGMDRTSFYEWKRRFQTHGIEGLKDLPPIHNTHPQTTPPEVEAKILQVSLKHPGYGCVKLSALLKLEGISVSSPTIQRILIKNNLGSKYHRLLRLEEEHLSEGFVLTPEQIRHIERANPCFKERHVESGRPGELLAADTFYVGTLKGVGRVYLHAVIDTFSSLAFGFLHTSKSPEPAVCVLHNDALPFYQDRGICVNAILTDNGTEFCGKETHSYELYLALNDIEHRRTKIRTPKTNGFAERFNRTILDEFFRIAFRENLYETVEALQEDMDKWLLHYNTERPHLGYRNMGKRPMDTINEFLKMSGMKVS